MKKILASVIILFISFYCFSKTADSKITKENTNHKLTISGTLFYTSISRGGIQRDESNIPLIPLKKFTLYVIRFASMDSIPVVIKSFTTNKDGTFSVSLPPGKYGFVSSEEAKNPLLKGQCLPKNTETKTDNIINSSVWECNMVCSLDLNTDSIKNLIIIMTFINKIWLVVYLTMII